MLNYLAQPEFDIYLSRLIDTEEYRTQEEWTEVNWMSYIS